MTNPIIVAKNTINRISPVIRRTAGYIPKWVRIAISIIIVCLITYTVVRLCDGQSRRIRLAVTSQTPIPTHFTDDVSAAFLSSDNIPDINNNRDTSNPGQFVIDYEFPSDTYTDVFIPNLTTTELGQNIKITPFLKGTWHHSYQRLVFTPEQNWPANTKFTVRVNKNIFAAAVRPETYTQTFRTPDITATVDSFNIYPDVTQPQSMIGVAVISFNYPINTADFADKVLLKLDGRKLNFNVKFDRFHRTAFIISDPVAITNSAQVMRLKLNRIPDQAGNTSTKKLTAHTTLESADNFFKITAMTTSVAENADGNSQQLLLLNTTVAAKQNTQWSKHMQIYLLPEHHPDIDDADEPHEWAIDEITPEILKKSETIKFRPVDFVSPNGIHLYAFAFEVSKSAPRSIYVDITPGMKSNGDFEMKSGITRVMDVPYPEQTVKIAGSGNLLSLSGDQKLGIMARGGVSQAYVNLFKVKTSEINHLISQTYDLFSNDLEFRSYSFSAYDMSVVFQKTVPFSNTNITRTNYASLDLGEYLDRTGTDKTGIFIIQAAPNKDEANYSDQRLIMLTNMGIIRKRNQDDSSSVFVANLYTGEPASDVEISVLGRNGNSVWAGRTDEDGHATIPTLSSTEYKNARKPVAIVARNNNDVSFIPYNWDYATATEFSKFAIDGEYVSHTTPLNAFVFSDRGVYRPGETVTIGGIVKNKAFKSLSGIPIKIEILDSRGRDVFNRPISLESDGMFDTAYAIPASGATGTYTIRIFSLNSKNKVQDMLGHATFSVEEFTADTMKIYATIQDSNDNGWISTDEIQATVLLQNMFGTPASDRRISATASLTPTDFTFPEYKNYTFTPHFKNISGMSAGASSQSQTYSVTLSDIRTDDKGTAILTPDFKKSIISGTYLLSLQIKGYEPQSGKNVQTTITSRASTNPYLVGFKSSTDLEYIPRNSTTSINLIAIDNNATPISISDLTLRLVQRENLTSLIKDNNDYYKYQTVTRDKTVYSRDLSIPDTGIDIPLDTSAGGTYFLQVLDKSGKILTNTEYFVAASDNASLQTDTQAEMKIKLDKSSYKPGEQISVNIRAPFAGTGLITIERDRVYAYKWFRTQSTTSIQTITVPEKFEGTGYINVAFVRDINSNDIFTNPYSYAVAPFASDISAHKIDVKLSAPQKIDSNKLTIEYQTNADARIMIFAINTGILQVAKYKIPTPIAHFFKKAALQVETYQTLSLLLPEYKILREFAKTGGGDYADMADIPNQILTNPFARKTSEPIAFYSGILSAKSDTPGSITFDIPNEFNGSITTFAIAATDSAMGSAHTETKVQAPIIIATTMPTFVAPTDTINIGVTASNMTPDSGSDATIALFATTSDNLSLTGGNNATLNIPENTEQTINWSLAAGNTPGNAEITINANLFAKSSVPLATRQSITTTSIRPTSAYTTHITTGEIKSTKHTIKNFQIPMYETATTRQLYISHNANAAIKPLFEYLHHYDFNCSEQMVSRTIPYVLMPRDGFIGTTYSESAQKITETINILKTRQNDDGSFELWSGGTQDINNQTNAQTAYLTAYVTQFLTLARDKGFTVPRDMLSRAVDYLRTYAGSTITDNYDAAATAYAIYVITTNGYVTTSYINLFEEYARSHIKNWEQDLMGAYIATSYKLLKQSDKADNLISKYKMSRTDRFIYTSMFSNNVADDAMYTYLLARHFKSAPSTTASTIQEYLNNGNYSAYTSAVVILALANVKSGNNTAIQRLSVTADGSKLTGKITSDTYIVDLPANINKLTIECPYCNRDTKLLYTTIQQGYPTRVTPATNGLELVREYYDASGNRITTANIGDTVTVKIFARARTHGSWVQNIAIIDLLPGGFIPDSDSLNGEYEFVQVREDRVVIFTTLTGTTTTIEYKAQIGTAGTFAIAPIYAQSMYNPQINATGTTGVFTVSNAGTSE